MAVGKLELTFNLRRKGLNVFICWCRIICFGTRAGLSSDRRVHRCLPSGPTERPLSRLPSDPPSSAGHGRLEVSGGPGGTGSLPRLTFKKSFMNEGAERKTSFKDGGEHIRRAGRAPLGSGATSGFGLRSEDRKPAFPATVSSSVFYFLSHSLTSC